MGVLSLSCVHFSFAIILNGKRKSVALLLLSYRYLFVGLFDLILLRHINNLSVIKGRVLQMYCYSKKVIRFFLTVPWVGLQFVIVVYLYHTRLHLA